jgi:AcrR family transcriptional regulator
MAGGRPRAFDTEAALDRALDLFWRKGFEGTSLSDLTEAMGISRPSLYAAFGDKETLFRKVLERYAAGPGAFAAEALADPCARRAIERFLVKAAKALTDPRWPRGCLCVQGALACGDDAKTIRNELAAKRAETEAAVRDRLERAAATGEWIPADPTDFARYLAAVFQGMAVQATAGASREELLAVARLAMTAWPANDVTSPAPAPAA